MVLNNLKLVQIAEIVAAHGILGEVKINCYTEDPISLLSLKTIMDSEGRIIKLAKLRSSKPSQLIGRLENITTRNQAETLVGFKFYIHEEDRQETLPDEYYISELVGCVVQNEGGVVIGSITNSHNFGAGDVIEITFENKNKVEFFTFTKDIFPEINIKERVVKFCPPDFV